jgi:hypothetical protein
MLGGLAGGLGGMLGGQVPGIGGLPLGNGGEPDHTARTAKRKKRHKKKR